MLKKRQVLTIGGITLVASLVLLPALNIMGFSGNPFEQIWEAIDELQSRVDSIEEEQNQVRTIRFLEPNEFMVDSDTYTEIATIGTWVPNTETDNVLLNIVAYLQYRALEVTPSDPWTIYWRVTWTTQDGWGAITEGVAGTSGQIEHEEQEEYTWCFAFGNYERRGYPCQASYTMKLQAYTEGGRVAYLRNINVVLTVIDGLPASD